jgi:hypothetical protein
MIAVRDLSNPAIALEWHEAVAVVAALTATLWNARAAQAPTLDAAVLTLDGDVQVVGEGRLAGAVTSGLALALGALLEATPCPAELRHIVTANVGPAPELDSVNAFARALMFFERPGRVEVLRDLAARAGEALERARAAEELERLTERARHRAQQPAATALATAIPAAAASARRFAAPLAVGVTVFVAVALAAATLFTTPSSPPEAPLETGAVADDEAPAPPTSSTGAAGDSASAPVERQPPATESQRRAPQSQAAGPAVTAVAPPAAARPAASSATPPPHAASAAGSTVATAKSPNATSSADIVVRVTELGGSALPPTTSATGASRGTSRIYTMADAGVSPAVLVKPHLPAEPPSDVPPWEVGTLELTISTTGLVEQVHLISPYNRYQERMLVAAAKAWLFQPATRDGRPVRFRTRIRVTL